MTHPPLLRYLAWGALLVVSADAATLGDAGFVPEVAVADTHTLVPCPTPIPFLNFRYPFLDEEMNVTFIGDDNTRFPEKGRVNGIYRSDAKTGELTTLVDKFSLCPGTTNQMKALLGLRVDGSDFVFYRCYGYPAGWLYASFGGGPVELVAGPVESTQQKDDWVGGPWFGDIWHQSVVYSTENQETKEFTLQLYRHATRGSRPLLDSLTPVPALGGHRVGFLHYHPAWRDGTITLSARTDDNEPCVLRWSGVDPNASALPGAADVKVLVAPRTPIPLQSDLRFTLIESTPGHGDLAAFVGANEPTGQSSNSDYYERPRPGFWGVFCVWKGRLINIVDNCTEIPGRTDCFAWFSKWLAADDKQVVFRGRSADGFEGLYLYRPETDRLYTITDTTHPIEGRGVISYELSSRPVVGNRIAVMVRFADGGFGEYLASMPGLPVTKLVRHPAAKTGPSSPGK